MIESNSQAAKLAHSRSGTCEKENNDMPVRHLIATLLIAAFVPFAGAQAQDDQETAHDSGT